MTNDDPTPGRASMARLRDALFRELPTRTAADFKGNREMALAALNKLAPTSPLRVKLAACGTRNQSNDSRVFCEHPACAVCMKRRSKWLFDKRLWPALEAVPPDRLRWVTVLLFERADLDDGAAEEMNRQHRRLQHVLKKFAGDAEDVRVWGAREVEKDGAAWVFHVHLLVDLGTTDADRLADMLRDAWGRGDRQVQVKTMKQRSHRANVSRLAKYMTKARYTEAAEGERKRKREWMSYDDILALITWRDARPAQWHRFTWGIRGASDGSSSPSSGSERLAVYQHSLLAAGPAQPVRRRSRRGHR